MDSSGGEEDSGNWGVDVQAVLTEGWVDGTSDIAARSSDGIVGGAWGGMGEVWVGSTQDVAVAEGDERGGDGPSSKKSRSGQRESIEYDGVSVAEVGSCWEGIGTEVKTVSGGNGGV